MNNKSNNEEEVRKVFEFILTAIIFCVLMYYIGIPVLHFIDRFFDVIGGRG